MASGADWDFSSTMSTPFFDIQVLNASFLSIGLEWAGQNVQNAIKDLSGGLEVLAGPVAGAILVSPHHKQSTSLWTPLQNG